MRLSDKWVILNPSSPAWAALNFQFVSEWLSYFDVHLHLLECWLKILVLRLILKSNSADVGHPQVLILSR